MLKTLMDAATQSGEELRKRISKVKYHGDGIAFYLDDTKYVGELKGRNANKVLGFGPEIDAGLALRVYLDGDAKPEN